MNTSRLNPNKIQRKMGSELLINVTPSEARVALVEHGVLQEVHIERRMKRGLVGNIYKGKISRVKQKETSERMSLFAGAEGGI